MCDIPLYVDDVYKYKTGNVL